MSEVTSAAPVAAPESSAPAAESSAAQTSEIDADIESSAAPVDASLKPSQEKQVKEAIKDGASPAEVKQMIKEFDLKVNGKTVKKKLDMNDEKAVIRELQLAAAGQSAMQESAEIKKLLQKELDRLKTNPFDVLKELGQDPDKLITDYVTAMMKEAEKTPEQKEQEKRSSELEAERSKNKRLEEEMRTEREKRMIEKAEQELESDMKSAFEKSGSKRSKRLESKIYDIMSWAIDNGHHDVKVADILPVAEQEVIEELNDMFNDMPIDFMEKYLGTKNLEKWRSEKVKKMKEESRKGTGEGTRIPQTAAAVTEKVLQNESKKRMGMKEFMRSRINEIAKE